MLEFLLIVFIILLFIFPVLALAVLLRLLTTAVLYRKLYLFGHQLTEGKNILVPNGITQCGNFITSIVMTILSSGVVFILIINNILLFAFNMVFCAFVSLRWFDYTHNMHRDAIRKMNPKLPEPSNGRCLWSTRYCSPAPDWAEECFHSAPIPDTLVSASRKSFSREFS